MADGIRSNSVAHTERSLRIRSMDRPALIAEIHPARQQTVIANALMNQFLVFTAAYSGAATAL